MKRLALAAILLLAGCGDGNYPSNGWTVTETHIYPAHSRVTFTGQCPANLATDQPLPVSCTRNEVTYPVLYEVCARKDVENACWYLGTGNVEIWFGDQKIDQEPQDFEPYIFINKHPHPTNEWDKS